MAARTSKHPKARDLTQFRESDTTEIDIQTPAGEDTGVRFTVLGPKSARASAVDEAHPFPELPAADAKPEERKAWITAIQPVSLERAIRYVVGWRQEPDLADAVNVGGETLACTPENVRRLLTLDGFGFMAEAVTIAHGERARFFPKPNAS